MSANDWQSKPLGEICNIALGKTPARKSKSFWDEERITDNVWLSVADLKNTEGKFVSDSKEYISDEGKQLCKPVKEGTLLVSFKLTLGRLAIAGRELYTNEAIAALSINDENMISREYLFYYLHYFDWDAAAVGMEKVKGKTLNKAILKTLEIRFPPLREQQRIVSILDEAFEDIKDNITQKQNKLQSAEELFQSTLYSKFAKKGETWIDTTIGNEVDFLAGFAFKSSQYTEDQIGIKLLRGDNIIQGRLRWDGVKRWPKDEYDDYEKFALQEHDVVLAMDRPWVSAGFKFSSISKDDLPCLQVQRTARMRAGENLHWRFLFYLIGSHNFIQEMLGGQTGLGVPHISGKQILGFSFARPSIDEQITISELLDSISENTQRLKENCQFELNNYSELKQSILQEAFSGKLSRGVTG